MRDILVIGARGVPNVQGGLEKHAETLFPYFAEAGYDVELVGLKQHILMKEFKGVKLTGLPTLSFLNTDKLIYHITAILYVLRHRPRLLHLQGLNAALFLTLYRLLGLKIVLRYGSADYDYGKLGPVSSVILRLCEYQLRFADHVITVSQHYCDRLVAKHNLKNITVVPNGTEKIPIDGDQKEILQRYGLGEKPFVLSVGRITPEKDYKTLIDAYKRLGREDVTLVIAGGSGDVNYADQYLRQNSDSVRLIGQVPRSELGALFANCALYVCSSIHEGQSNAVLEALAYEKPVIASRIPANIELSLQQASYFEVEDVEALADAMSSALKKPEAFVFCAQHMPNWKEVFQQTATVYRSVVPELGTVVCSSRSDI